MTGYDEEPLSEQEKKEFFWMMVFFVVAIGGTIVYGYLKNN
jgi:hypothetical protein